MGPSPASPEQTDVPWVGYGVPFELHWFVGASDAVITGYRYKASQLDAAPFVPAAIDSVAEWSDRTQATFSNDGVPGDVDPADCPGGIDCPSMRRWPSSSAGPYRFQLESIDDLDRVRHFEFAFEVNYPPDTRILRQGLPASQSGVEFPRYWSFDDNGDWVARHIAEGDTIPSGSYAVFAVEGEDRLASEVATDSFCCDLLASLDGDVVRRQWRAEGTALDDRGVERSVSSLWTDPATVDTTGFFVGPFDYRVSARAVDEHGRRDPSPDEFTFVGGFAPRLQSIEPRAGESILIGQAGADPSSSRAVSVTGGVTLYWDPVLDQYYETQYQGTQAMSGTVYSMSLHFTSAPDPRESGPLPSGAGSGFGRQAGSWAYRYRSEFDPANDIAEGDGDGDLRHFVDGNVDGSFDGSQAVSIFVPDIFWSSPELFDSSGPCVAPEFCDQGDYLRKHLGEISLELQAKGTRSGGRLRTYPYTLRPADGGDGTPVDLSELGRRTPILSESFEVRLVLGGSPGSLQLWPPRP
jgi:hypothetical protein